MNKNPNYQNMMNMNKYQQGMNPNMMQNNMGGMN
jgi:hypothetical protein